MRGAHPAVKVKEVGTEQRQLTQSGRLPSLVTALIKSTTKIIKMINTLTMAAHPLSWLKG